MQMLLLAQSLVTALVSSDQLLNGEPAPPLLFNGHTASEYDVTPFACVK